MKPRWRLMLFLAVLFCVLLTQSGRRGFPVQTRKLTDGSTLKLVNITYGTHHRHREGNVFDRWLHYGTLRRYPFDRDGEVETPADVPVAWILYTPPPGRAPAPGMFPGNTLSLDHWTLFDEHGCEVVLGPRSWPLGGFGHSQQLLTPTPLTPMSHRSKRLGIRFWATRVNAPATPEAEFEVLEREEVTAKVAPPERLPSTKPFSDLRVTLASFENGVDMYADSPRSKQIPMRSPSDVLIRALVRVDSAAKRTPAWEPKGIRFVDSGGNVFDPRPHVTRERKGDRMEMRIFGSLWNHEPAYDVEVEMGRTQKASFRKEELHTVDLPVPARGSNPDYYPYARFEIDGKSVEVSDPYWGRTGPPQLVIPFDIRSQPTAGPRIVLVRVIDDKGRTVPPGKNWDRDDHTHFQEKGGELTQAKLSVWITKPARTLKVTFALAQPEWVRFHVKPTQWTPLELQANRFR